MISTLKRWVPLATAMFMVATPAFSQAPTDAQRSAIRSECRSDYEAHCASIPPGGAASLQCLQKNMSSLAPGCQAAVRAVEAPAAAPKADTAPAAAPKAETAPAAPAPAKSAATTMAKPSSAQISAIRSACRSDYPKVCAGVPTGGAPALECLEKNKARVSASCQKAVAAATGNAFLTRAIEEIRMRLNDAMTLLPESDTWHTRMEGEHEALVEAIDGGDAETAETLMQEHVASSEQGLRAVLAAIRRRGMWKQG